jgi:carbonic anhydrase/acetyltransferase-like protein (isoleucine patch superfamily)
MRKLLICPSPRNGVPFLSRDLPLANIPLLGQSLLEYWLSTLAIGGVKQVLMLAHDRPELALEVVGAGERWGLEATVVNESRELTAAEALLKYAAELEGVPALDAIAVLDHFPGLPEQPLFVSYERWFAAIRCWMPAALMADRVGVNEALTGVWKGCHTHVSPQADLRPPCWIGQHVFVGAHAVVGPGAILEDGSFVEPGAELAESWVGPDTFVGQFAQIKNSLAWGSTLVNWQTGSEAQVADPFLLCAVRRSRRKRTLGWFRKLSDLYERNKTDVEMLWKHLLLHKQG